MKLQRKLVFKQKKKEKENEKEFIKSSIINLNNAHENIKFDSLEDKSNIILIDEKELSENNKENSIIKIEENANLDEGMDALFDLINDNGLDKILNCLMGWIKF